MLDTACLAELDPSGQNGLIGRVLATYQRSSRDLLERLHAAAGAQDQRAFFLAVHTLKSSSVYVGAHGLAKVCAAVERRLREQPDGMLAPELTQVQAAAAPVMAALDQYFLAQGGPEASTTPAVGPA